MPPNPQPQSQNPAGTAGGGGGGAGSAAPKKRKHRGGKRRKNRRQSFAAPSEAGSAVPANAVGIPRDPLVEAPEAPLRSTLYRRNNRSDESLESEALLDHRDQPQSMRPRRESRLPALTGMGMGMSMSHRNGLYAGTPNRQHSHQSRSRSQGRASSVDDEDGGLDMVTDRTPLMVNQLTHHTPKERESYGGFAGNFNKSRDPSRGSGRRHENQNSYHSQDAYDVNNPPSRPASPDMPPKYGLMDEDADAYLTKSPNSRRSLRQSRDALIDIDTDLHDEQTGPDGLRPGHIHRHQTISLPVEGDVCFPAETMSELEFDRSTSITYERRPRRRRREWPQLWALDEWSQQEKEQRAGIAGVKKTSEPVLIEGRLRPTKHQWHRLDEDVPYRYTYFNEDFESTIHAQTISELVQPGGSFKELFIPDPPVLSDSSDSEDDTQIADDRGGLGAPLSPRSVQQGGRDSTIPSQLNTVLNDVVRTGSRAPSVRAPSVRQGGSGDQTPSKTPLPRPGKPKKYGEPPTFWLDVLSPTEHEMRVLCKTFGIHALTSEDIMMQEAREKVELFKDYYFINYRTFEQDTENEDYMEPINMYVIVFRQGILTFHWSQIPHPANVRRRIRQLSDYLALNSDWIGYAIIDDVTDVYQPLIHNIEAEVDEIDEQILRAFQDTNELSAQPANSANAEKDDESEKPMTGIEMLQRIGECRKKVMSLYRLLGNKADVIKGFAKRCTEQWQVAPRSEIGLYLGDIQDHILTMTSNLSHYETLLSRAHSNYLAQVSIRMNERQEQTSDVLGKLTVVGTIVLPMNIICGMWGMNVKVPGQDIDNLNWFWSITAGLALFALACYLFCKKVYKIV